MTTPIYANFELHIERDGDQYRTRVGDAPRGQGTESTVVPPFGYRT